MNPVVPRFQLPYGATAEFRGLVNGWNETPLIAADIASIEWTLYEVVGARRTLVEVDGYTEIAIVVADVISDVVLQGRQIRYNFFHTPQNRTTEPFMLAGKVYRIQYTVTPANAAEQLIVVPFEVEVV